MTFCHKCGAELPWGGVCQGCSPPLRPTSSRAPRPRRRRRGPRRQSTAPLIAFVVVPVVLTTTALMLVSFGILELFGFHWLALSVIAFAGLCLPELVVAPMLAARSGRDAGLWFLATVLWQGAWGGLSYYLFLGGTFAISVGVRTATSAPESSSTTTAIGVGLVFVSVFLLHLPLVALALSPRVRK